MKILHVETGRHFYGGAQQVAYLVRGLALRGVQNVAACPPGTEVAAELRAAGAKVRELACGGDVDLAFSWRLARVIRAERPDLIHCHSRRGGDVLGGLASLLARVPAVVSRRVDHPESRLLAGLRYRPFRRIVAISENVAASLAESGIDPQRISVIRSAVDLEAFAASAERARLEEEFGIGAAATAVAAVGQLIPRKGHRYLLDAAAVLLPDLPDLKVVIFGRGDGKDGLVEQAERLGLGPAVQFAGYRQDLDEYLAAFDLCVHPALREGLGVAMLKAAAAGLPVVAFDVAGSREVVKKGETGILVAPKDVAALAKAIRRLAGDESLRHRLGEAARRRMQDKFSIDAMVDRHLELYRTVLE